MAKKLADGEIKTLPDGTRIISIPGRRAPRVISPVGPKTKTQQHFKDESDINTIVSRYMKSGFDDRLINIRQGVYGDFTNLPDYQTSLNTVIAAQNAFDDLPSVIRDRFNNDPSKFMAFMSDPANNAEMVKLGLATEVLPDPEPTPQKVIVVNPEAPQS